MADSGEQLIPMLQQLQDAYGYLPTDLLTWVSRKTGIPTATMHGVITFYAQFHTSPRGKHTIRCCQGTACHVKGGKRIADTLRTELGIGDGGTTKDGRFTLEMVQCLGTCFLAPVIMIDDDYFGELTPEATRSLLARFE